MPHNQEIVTKILEEISVIVDKHETNPEELVKALISVSGAVSNRLKGSEYTAEKFYRLADHFAVLVPATKERIEK